MFLLNVDVCTQKHIQSPCSEGCLVLEYIHYEIIFMYSKSAYEKEFMHKNIQPPEKKKNLTTNKRKCVVSHVFVTSSF